jgi:hypothetical protein
MVLIVADYRAVNFEKEEVSQIYCEYDHVVIYTKDKKRHVFYTKDPKSFFDHACALLKHTEP